MAHNLQAHFEAEADHKHLTGDARAEYIGGAWHRVKTHNRKGPWWLQVEDKERLEKVTGPIDEIMHPKGRKSVVIRQGEQHYEMPEEEYFALVRAGKEIEQDERREARERRRGLRAAEKDRIRQERMVRTVEKIEYSDVLTILRRAGGIRRHKTAGGREEDRGEYNMLPRSVRARQSHEVRALGGHHGLTLDEAATAVNQHMPWLQIDTPDDLVQFFERHEDRRLEMVELSRASRVRLQAERAEAERIRKYHADRQAKKESA